jgi:hypothetical protein
LGEADTDAQIPFQRSLRVNLEYAEKTKTLEVFGVANSSWVGDGYSKDCDFSGENMMYKPNQTQWPIGHCFNCV